MKGRSRGALEELPWDCECFDGSEGGPVSGPARAGVFAPWDTRELALSEGVIIINIIVDVSMEQIAK